MTESPPLSTTSLAAGGWRHFLLPGDCLLILLALVLVFVSFPLFWQGGKGTRAVIRLDGKVFQEVPLGMAREIRVPGALGETVIQIEKDRARVRSDPGPRQYCVRQGWLSAAGDMALCAPSRVSLSIEGDEALYDALNY
ncbi:MAG: NusG domain II-containing protein [Zoogloeaceae bacterium]|jgi:hypothetical protein|nr:NusG domain II-containing protein [Zoogloeaceae bacterium]